jgi:hypothetical protein
MATTPGQNIIDGVVLGTTLTPILTITSNLIRTKIDAINFTNYSSGNVLLTVQIVSSGSSAGNGKLLVDAKEIRSLESYQTPELIGQGIAVGGTLQAFSSVADSINCTATGTEYSS